MPACSRAQSPPHQVPAVQLAGQIALPVAVEIELHPRAAQGAAIQALVDGRADLEFRRRIGGGGQRAVDQVECAQRAWTAEDRRLDERARRVLTAGRLEPRGLEQKLAD